MLAVWCDRLENAPLFWLSLLHSLALPLSLVPLDQVHS